MKRNISLLILITFIHCGALAQTHYPFTANSPAELLLDEQWTKKTAAQLLIEYAKLPDSIQNTTGILQQKLSVYAILDDFSEGNRLSDSALADDGFPKVLSIYFKAYFMSMKSQGKVSFYSALKSLFDSKKFNVLERQQYAFMRPAVYQHGMQVTDFAIGDSDRLAELFDFWGIEFHREEKVFSAPEIMGIIPMAAFVKIGNQIANDQEKFAAGLYEVFNSIRKINVPKEVDDAMTELFPDNEPGASVVLMKGDKIIVNKGYGLADMVTKTPITPATNFCIGSVSKMFMAASILLLKEQGKLDLHDPIIKYLNDVNPKIGNKITIHHLLTHTSGLPRWMGVIDPVASLTMTDRQSYEEDKHTDSLLFEPGNGFEYSNIGYRWLVVIVENVSGQSYSDFLKQNVFEKAGMENSFAINKGEPFAHAYKTHGKQFVEFDEGEEMQFSTLGDGGLFSSANDFIAWEKSIRLNQVLSAYLFQKSITPYADSRSAEPNSHYGYGWFISNDVPTEYYHSGGNGAFVTYFHRIPEKNIMMAIFINRLDRYGIDEYVMNLMKRAGWF